MKETIRQTSIGIAYLDGRRVRRAMSAGLRSVVAAQAHLNKINVYPVADGDTGTNLALTMSSINGVIQRSETRNAGDVFTAIADAAIDGARGNSGAIVAQFLQGLSDSLTGLARITARQFARAVKTGETYARDAMARPVEGTVLTVMGEFADHLVKLTTDGARNDFVTLWRKGLAVARRSLAETPMRLEALRKAGVVDAGAEGFVDLLQGIDDFIRAGDIGDDDHAALPTVQHVEGAAAGEAADLTYRYCTECVVTGHSIDRRKLKETLMDLGDSLVLAGTHSRTRIHIHVNDPNAVFRVAAEFGSVGGTKADDMQRQQQESHQDRRRVAVLMDSAGDLPDEELERARIHLTPLRVHFGEESFLDKVSITSDEFYRRVRSDTHPPKTSQPVPGDYRRDFQFLSSHYDSVVCVTLLGSVSGTYQSAVTGAQRSGAAERIRVIDSHNVSVGQGLLALYAAECADAGYDADAIAKALIGLREQTRIYSVVRDLSAAVRGGRVGAPVKRVADLLHLIPVLGVRPGGRFGAHGVLFGRRKLIERTVRFVLKRLDPDTCYRVAVGHADCEDDARRLLAGLREGIPNIDATYFTQVGSALGAHTGPSAVAAAVQPYTPPARRGDDS